MRPLLALAMSVAILGLVQAYMDFQRATAVRLETDNADEAASRTCAFRGVLNFAAEADVFNFDSASVEIRRIGAAEPLLRHEAPLAAGEPLEASLALPHGEVNLVFEATPAGGADFEPSAPPQMEIELRCGEQLIQQALPMRREADVWRAEAALQLP
ncbi:MAG: hypothetical protein KDB14_14835 [Planctomycetales bacterium]|nr:hypothetical protein [Planctomycetales bacterium]